MKSTMRWLSFNRFHGRMIALIVFALGIFLLFSLLYPDGVKTTMNYVTLRKIKKTGISSSGSVRLSNPGSLLEKIRATETAQHITQEIDKSLLVKTEDNLPRDTGSENRIQEIDSSSTEHHEEIDLQQSSVAASHLGKYGDIRKFSVSKDPEMQIRQEKVKEMLKHAWDGYKKCAWGENEVMPITCHGSGGTFPGVKVASTIVDALDTLYMMNMMEEFNEGRDWVATHLSQGLNQERSVSVFEFNIRHLGGLLSAYALSGDQVFLVKAIEVGNKLLPAFNTTTGIADSSVNLRHGHHSRVNWASGAILSEFGSLHLEFIYLSEISGLPIYGRKVQKIRQFLKNKKKYENLYPNFIDPKSGEWGVNNVALGAFGDSFYEYLIKSYIQSDRRDALALDMYVNTVRAIKRRMVRKSKGNLTYVGDIRGGMLENRMEHLACFSGGMFALGAAEMPEEREKKAFLNLGAEITKSCHVAYNKTDTGLGPEVFRFEAGLEAVSAASDPHNYLLRPEVVESYFVLWRLTHDLKYREWGWQVVQALEAHSRVKYGYTGISNVYKRSSPRDNTQQSFFLAETLKYLYLLFSDDDLLPLDAWVFNTEAHPLPVIKS